LNDRTWRPPSSSLGFSLLEVLVAMALAASALSIAGIAVAPLIERSERSGETRLVEALVRDARMTAMVDRRTLSLSDHAAFFFASIGADPFLIEAELTIYPNGRCSAGTLRAITTKRVRDFELEDDKCTLKALS
jgi:prepilin-type N-terminal cleavage/methylation domain-containing protein